MYKSTQVYRSLSDEDCSYYNAKALASVSSIFHCNDILGNTHMSKTIIILSTPRSLSTALLMSMRSRGDMVVLHEPGLRAYNEVLKKSASQATEFIDYMLKTLPADFKTYDALIQHLNELTVESDQHVFIKEMIFTASEYMEAPFFDNAEFFFLIRSPEYSLISFYKESKQPLNAEMAPALSYENLLNFYKKLKSMNRNVHIIKSEDLIQKPGILIKDICSKSGIIYDERQLSWQPLAKDITTISRGSAMLPGWHDTAKTSSGFDKGLIHHVSRHLDGTPTFAEIPEEYRQGYLDFWKKQVPFYEHLCSIEVVENSSRKDQGVTV